jgi:mRNA-degrading endonuclease toxin of MazEF toxin-antitoxin module
MIIAQYQVVLVNLDPTIGSEMKKLRPCVVVSPDEMNRHLQTVTIAPMTSASKPYPTRVLVNHNNQSGWVQVASDLLCTCGGLGYVAVFVVACCIVVCNVCCCGHHD